MKFLRIAAGIFFLQCTGIQALDLEIRSFSCDESLPVYVLEGSVEMECSHDEKNRCTFGDYAIIKGQLYYNGVGDIEMDGNTTAYISGQFDISVDYLVIPKGTKMNLCTDDEEADSSAWITAVGDGIECPQDGTYDFVAGLHLPSYGSSWLATGWHDYGEVSLYADANQEYLIGSCEIHYVTQVTSNSSIHPLSAFATVFIVGGVALVGVTWILFFALFVRRRNEDHEHLDDDEYKLYYLNGHVTMTDDSDTTHTEEEDTALTSHNEIDASKTRPRWQGFVSKLGGFVCDPNDLEVPRHPRLPAGIPRDVSYDSGVFSSRSRDDGTVELSHIASMGSVDDSTLSGASSSAASSSSSSSVSCSASSSAPSSVAPDRYEPAVKDKKHVKKTRHIGYKEKGQASI